MTIVKAETAPYFEAFRERSRDAEEPGWLAARREAALLRFGELGFPTRRQEAWRFTNLRALQGTTYPPATGIAAVPSALVEALRLPEATHRLVFVNSRFAPELSLLSVVPAGAWLATVRRTLSERPDLLAAALDDSDTAGAQPFASLNAAFFADGFVLALEPGVVLDRPVQIIHIGRTGTPQAAHVRNLLLLRDGSRATVVETFTGEGAYWSNSVTALRLGERAELHRVKVQSEGREAVHLGLDRVTLADDARYESFVLTLGARLSRHDTLATIAGERAHCAVHGAYLLRGDQEATNATVIDHAASHGTTREVWMGVVDERAHGVFLGRIAVRPEAQKTDAEQLNHNLLLSPRATVDTKPELEILADDVKCSHGATVGDLDENALFYLRTRGIGEAEARHMLTDAFIAEAIATVEDAGLRAYLGGHVQRWLSQSGGASKGATS
ncbi:MAG TPA: Fe-S cluster assembly protein SufD [Stellaceae bacterium]|nr:Fe-S cluster assembly protein SufD [Stellaceae bacterium]